MDNSSNNIQKWQESFSLLEEEEEEYLEEDTAGRNTSDHNRSFVDFLLDGNANSNTDEAEAFETVPDVYIPEETLSDSFITRSYPTSSVLTSVDESNELEGTSGHFPLQIQNRTTTSTASGPAPVAEPAASSPPPVTLTNEAANSGSQFKTDKEDPQKTSTNANNNEPGNSSADELKQSGSISDLSQVSNDNARNDAPSPPAKNAPSKPKLAKSPPTTVTQSNTRGSKSSQQSNQPTARAQPTPVAPAVAASVKPDPQQEDKQQQQQQQQQRVTNDCLALDPLPSTEESNPDNLDTSPQDNSLDNQKDSLHKKQELSEKKELSDTAHRRASSLEEEKKDVYGNEDEDDDDDTSKVSDSYHSEGPDSVDLAQKNEQNVRKSLLLTLLSFLGIVFLMKYIDKCCQCCQKTEDNENEAAADLMGNQGDAVNVNASGGGSNSGPNNNNMVQQMAVAASQSAAASAVAGSSAMATASAAGAGAVGSGGLIATGMVVAGAMTAVAVGTAVATRGGKGVDPIWMCNDSVIPNRYEGHVVLYLEGINDSSWLSSQKQRTQLEDAFLQEYNQLGCQETYQRILESIELHENDWEELGDGTTTYFRTNWTASVLCNGACPELEPLFYIRAADYVPSLYGYSRNTTTSSSGIAATSAPVAATSRSSTRLRGLEKDKTRRRSGTTHRGLQQPQISEEGGVDIRQEAWFLMAFASNFSQALSAAMASADSSTETNVVVFDGYTQSSLDGSLLERIGTADKGSPFSSINVTQDILEITGAFSSQLPVYDDPIPVCSNTTTQIEKTGFLQLQVENFACQDRLAEEAFVSQLENLFRAVFNRVGKGCDGLFQRVMQSANITKCVSMKATDAERGEVFFADMEIEADVLCDGCSPAEPVFLESARRLLRRRLEGAIFLEEFVSNLTLALETYFDGESAEVDVFYAATMSTVDMQSIVQFIGQPLSGIPVILDQDSSQQDINNPDSETTPNTNASSETYQGSQPCEAENGETLSFGNGRVNLFIENMPPELLDLTSAKNRKMVERHFGESYNFVSGRCEGEFKRVVHYATLLNFTHHIRDDGVPFVNTSWVAKVSCSGCNPKEPLFLGHQVSSSRALQMDVSSMLGRFSSKFDQALDIAIRLESGASPADWQRIAIFYLEALSSAGTEVMESTGYHPKFYVNTGTGNWRPSLNGDGWIQSGPNEETDGAEILEACLKDLVLVDSNKDNMLNEMEYLRFVHRLIPQLDSSVDTQQLQKTIPSFESLPPDVQEGFNRFATGGEISIYGDKQEDVPVEQHSFLLGFCSSAVNETSHLLWGEFDNDTSRTSGPTRATPTAIPLAGSGPDNKPTPAITVAPSNSLNPPDTSPSTTIPDTPTPNPTDSPTVNNPMPSVTPITTTSPEVPATTSAPETPAVASNPPVVPGSTAASDNPSTRAPDTPSPNTPAATSPPETPAVAFNPPTSPGATTSSDAPTATASEQEKPTVTAPISYDNTGNSGFADKSPSNAPTATSEQEAPTVAPISSDNSGFADKPPSVAPTTTWEPTVTSPISSGNPGNSASADKPPSAAPATATSEQETPTVAAPVSSINSGNSGSADKPPSNAPSPTAVTSTSSPTPTSSGNSGTVNKPAAAPGEMPAGTTAPTSSPTGMSSSGSGTTTNPTAALGSTPGTTNAPSQTVSTPTSSPIGETPTSTAPISSGTSGAVDKPPSIAPTSILQGGGGIISTFTASPLNSGNANRPTPAPGSTPTATNAPNPTVVSPTSVPNVSSSGNSGNPNRPTPAPGGTPTATNAPRPPAPFPTASPNSSSPGNSGNANKPTPATGSTPAATNTPSPTAAAPTSSSPNGSSPGNLGNNPTGAQGDAPGTTNAPQDAPTSGPTATTNYGSPTTPSAIHNNTNTPLEMRYQIMFYIGHDGYVDREPTQEEYEGLRTSLEAYFFQLIAQNYEDSSATELVQHDLILKETQWIETPTDSRYSQRLTFESYYAFTGVDPPITELFGVYDNMSLQQLTQQAVWDAPPGNGIFYYTAGILWTNSVSNKRNSFGGGREYDAKRRESPGS